MAGRPQRSAKMRAFGMGILPQGQHTNGMFLPAPVGGLNTISPAGQMPPTDCLALKNLIPFQYGLRVRSGSQDWFIGIKDATTGEFDTITNVLSFAGSTDNGTQDRLFAVTVNGIYDVTTSQPVLGVYTSTPEFGVADGWTRSAKAGRGPCVGFANANGEHFLAYTDSVNGYMVYRESTGTWEKIAQGTGTGQVSGANPGSFRFVTYWKNRLWFVPGNSTKTYYLPARAYAGAVAELNFAPRAQYGGSLVGLWNWTLDGGQGIDDLIVGVLSGGDVAVYQGTDPSLPGAFGLKGVYWVGPVPPGRTIATNFGGDVFILALAGCMPVSRLVNGGLIRDPNTYETAKVTNLFNKLMSERGGLEGWAITQHPTDNLLVVNVPSLYGQPSQQLSMSLGTKGWSSHEGLAMTCMTTWHGKLFFGTSDGRVMVNDGATDSGLRTVLGGGEVPTWGYVDDGPQEIDFALFTAYQNLGNARKKRVHMARPYFITDGQAPGYAVQARYDYDLRDVPLADVPAVDAVTGGWGSGLWNVALWGTNTATAGRQYGTAGMGTAVAVVLRGTTFVDTTLVGMDILVDQGGLL